MQSVLRTLIVKHLKLFVLIFFFTLFTFHLALTTVLAGSGLVSQVGGATFIQGAKQFWVTSDRPTFSGVTTAGSTVTGTVGSQSVSATADSSGNWSWAPQTALSGDNSVTITSGATIASFSLTIGNVPASIATAAGTTLAPAGSLMPTLAILGFGAILTTFGLWGFRHVGRDRDI